MKNCTTCGSQAEPDGQLQCNCNQTVETVEKVDAQKVETIVYSDSNVEVKKPVKLQSESESEFEDREIDFLIKKMDIVRKAIREKFPKSNKFVEDSISCPICKKGTVNFMISDHYNGHIHAKCSKKNCIQWAE